MCVGIGVLERVCRNMCGVLECVYWNMRVGIRVLEYVCWNMCDGICVMEYVCRNMCDGICV